LTDALFVKKPDRMTKKLKKPAFHEIVVEDLAYGGRGIARQDGLVWFIDGAIPGQKVRVRIRKKRKTYIESYVVELLEPSPRQIDAPCPYFGICGGCQLQNMPYHDQCNVKADQVRSMLSHIGGIKNIQIEPVIPADPIYGYRNKMEFTFSPRRWLVNSEEKNPSSFALGFHPKRRFDKILDLKACLLQSDRANQLFAELKDLVRQSGLPCYNIKTHEGVWRFLVVREGGNTGDMMVNLITSTQQADKCRSAVAWIMDKISTEHPDLTTLIHSTTDRLAEIAYGEHEQILLGDGKITDRLGSRTYSISPNAFFQTNSFQAEKLFSTILKQAKFSQSDVVYDLYCGTAAIGIYIADHVRQVIGIEAIESAVEDGRRNIQMNHLQNIELIQADMKDILRDESFYENYPRPDAVVFDPPRGGPHPKTIRGLLELAPEKIIYVSCNPSILARDLQILCESRYQPVHIQPVDMFPHTGHIEVIAVLQMK